MEEFKPSEYVALLPAAGIGSRLPDRELSKELLPYGASKSGGKPIISHLLGCLGEAGVKDTIVVLREEKSDIQAYLAGPDCQDFDITCRMTPGTSGVPETVALGLEIAGARNVVFGFPDILFEPRKACAELMRRLDNTQADVVLGLFPTGNPAKFDMVEIDDAGRVLNIDIKPKQTSLTLTWILATWRPAFSEYLAHLVFDNTDRLNDLASGPGGSHLGHAFQLAMTDGHVVESVAFENGRTLDIGTPDDLVRAQQWGSHGHA